jgi:stage II sporulation protein D
VNLVRDRRALVALVAALGLAFLASHVFSWTEPKAATAAGPGIRVRLLGEPKLFTIDGSIEPMAEVGRELRPPIEVRTQSNGLLLIDTTGPVVLDQDKLRLSWSGRATLRYDSNGTRRETSQIGALQVAKRGDKLLLILHLDFELYVTGVVAAEVGGRFPLEALKAQAVAARGYALSAQRRRRDRSWDVRASPADQAFVAPSDEPAVVRAVRATTGLYLSWQGLPLRSYYHSTCGGRTRDGRECFGDVPAAPFASQYCNACRTAPRFRWQRTLDHAGLRTLCATGNTVSLQPKTRSARGDWRTFGASGGGTTTEHYIRRLMRLAQLPSPWIDHVEPTASGVTIFGHGFGHGVGLCQYGAAARARSGWNHRRILQHYYPGAELSTLRAAQ